VERHFEIVKREHSGKWTRTVGIAKDLGVSIKKGRSGGGIFRSPMASRSESPNQGELEPARQYDARQVLTFLRRVGRAAPDREAR